MARKLEAVYVCFRRWLYLPDPRALLAVLATVAANRLPGDPVWLVLVGPPGGGKSELLSALSDLLDVHPAATITEAALLSGTPKREQDNSAKGGLLRSIGEFGILVLKDLGSVLNMNRDTRAAMLAALREIYDGAWTRHVGTDGGRTLSWSGKVGLVAGCTPTIDRHHGVMSAMGERFLLFRLPPATANEQARRALAHAGRERAMRRELAAAVTILFADDLPEARDLSEVEIERLVSLATLVVRSRSAVERDGYSREIELIPESEAPTRLVVVLERLLAGLDVIGASRPAAWSVVTKAALDSIPALRRSAMEALAAVEGRLTTTEVAAQIAYPTQTTRRTLEDLVAHGIAERTSGGSGKADLWQLSDWARAQLQAATTTFPEKSALPFTLPLRVNDDFSGTPPGSENGAVDISAEEVAAEVAGGLR